VLGEIGTLAWTRRTNGLLRRSERARYIAAALREQALQGPRLIAWRLGRGGGTGEIDDEAMRIPDSKLAREAVEACAEVQSPMLMEHNYRSFFFARALGAVERVEHDAEVLFVATMFHDHGVLEPTGRCFTLRGADEAEQVAGVVAAEAITLHLNPAVPLEQGAEAHLMHDGVLLDGVGLRAWELKREAIERVRAAHPRLRFTQESGPILGAQARAIPRCRTAAVMRAGFGLALRLGPWRD
jgi:hypothetical protein